MTACLWTFSLEEKFQSTWLNALAIAFSSDICKVEIKTAMY